MDLEETVVFCMFLVDAALL